jgi:hypothetical protein
MSDIDIDLNDDQPTKRNFFKKPLKPNDQSTQTPVPVAATAPARQVTLHLTHIRGRLQNEPSCWVY